MIISEAFTLNTRPAFIAFEGINGCGKTTLHKLVSEDLRQAGHSVRDTREPGGTPLGAEIRKLLLEWGGEKKSDRSELLLFAADRAEHVDKVIRPSLSSGSWVLCDRFIYSTISFQGHGRGIDRRWINQAVDLAIQGTLPDLVILLDLSPEEAARRITARNSTDRDAFEEENLAFHGRIREGFLECARETPTPFLVLDATKTPEQLLALTKKTLGLLPPTGK
jgi:dTMP kinase